MAYAVDATHTLDKPILQALAASSATEAHPLGYTVVSTSGRKYRFVEVDSSTATTYPGYPAYYLPSTTLTVTGDQSDSAAGTLIGNSFAGVFCCTQAAGASTYSWIEVPNSALTADACVATSTTASANLIAVADDAFDVDPGTSASMAIVAIAMEADTSGRGDIIMIA